MTERGIYGLELDAWARAKAATKRITSRGRPPQQEEPDWETGVRSTFAPSGYNRPVARRATRPSVGLKVAAAATGDPLGTIRDGSGAGGAGKSSAPEPVASSDAAVRVVADLEGAS